MIVKKYSTDENTAKIFSDLDSSIMKISPKNIGCDEYPIYVTYYNLNTDVVFAVVYPKKEVVEIGLYLNKADNVKGLKSADHMKYPNITKSITIKKSKDINKVLLGILRASYRNSHQAK